MRGAESPRISSETFACVATRSVLQEASCPRAIMFQVVSGIRSRRNRIKRGARSYINTVQRSPTQGAPPNCLDQSPVSCSLCNVRMSASRLAWEVALVVRHLGAKFLILIMVGINPDRRILPTYLRLAWFRKIIRITKEEYPPS